MAAERIVSLQVLRFAAASGVIALHSFQTMSGKVGVGLVGDFGEMGVDLFFVLSGFVIARVAPSFGPSEFLRRRLARILPLYWILTFAWMAFLQAAGRLSLDPLVPSFSLLPAPHVWLYLNGAWTIRFELLFYSATAIVMLRPAVVLPAVLLAYAVALVANQIVGGQLLNFFGSPLILEFLAGVVISRLPRSAVGAVLAAIGAVTGLLIITRLSYFGDQGWTRAALYGLPAAFLVYAAVQIKPRSAFAMRLAYLGDASYSAYLVHQIPLALFGAVRAHVAAAPGAAFAVVVCWLLAILVHEGLEKPLLAFFRRQPASPVEQSASAWGR